MAWERRRWAGSLRPDPSPRSSALLYLPPDVPWRGVEPILAAPAILDA